MTAAPPRGCQTLRRLSRTADRRAGARRHGACFFNGRGMCGRVQHCACSGAPRRGRLSGVRPPGGSHSCERRTAISARLCRHYSHPLVSLLAHAFGRWPRVGCGRPRCPASLCPSAVTPWRQPRGDVCPSTQDAFPALPDHAAVPSENPRCCAHRLTVVKAVASSAATCTVGRSFNWARSPRVQVNEALSLCYIAQWSCRPTKGRLLSNRTSGAGGNGVGASPQFSRCFPALDAVATSPYHHRLLA